MRPVSLRLLIIFAGFIGLISYSMAGSSRLNLSSSDNSTDPATSDSPSSSSFGSTQAAATSTSPTSTPSSETDTARSNGADDNATVAGRDADGLPILKSKPGAAREKIIELKDGQKLPSSGLDPKFQGSLLNTSVDSIASIAPKTNKVRSANERPAFEATNLSLAQSSADVTKKNEPVSARSNETSSPTPTPSATASPAAKAASK